MALGKTHYRKQMLLGQFAGNQFFKYLLFFLMKKKTLKLGKKI